MLKKVATAKKVKMNKTTNLCFDLLYEMYKHYQYHTISTQTNLPHYTFHKNLSASINKHLWGYFSETIEAMLCVQDTISQTDSNFQLLNEEQKHFGIIYKYSEPQKYIDSPDCPFSYYMMAITISLVKEGVKLRCHKYIIKKGWVADPYHFILSTDFIEKNLKTPDHPDFTADIHCDFDIDADFDNTNYTLVSKNLKHYIDVLSKYSVYRWINKNSCSLFSEIFKLDHGKNQLKFQVEQI